MNPGLLPRIGGVCALLTQFTTFSQEWQTVDDFQYGSGVSSLARDVAADGYGNVFVTGGASGRGVTRRSANEGVSWSWETVDDCPDVGIFEGITVDPAGNVYVAGRTGPAPKWIVRRSVDSGDPDSWFTIDEHDYNGLGTEAWGIAAGPANTIYVVGMGNKKSGKSTLAHWLVRKSIDGGANWTTVDDYQYAGAQARALDVVVTSSGVFVVGDGLTSSASGSYLSSPRRWIVRKSSSGDAGTWSVVDDFAFASGRKSFYDAIGWSAAADPTGQDVYVSGWARTVSGTQWVVRRSRRGGSLNTWEIADVTSGSVNAVASGLGFDAYGDLLAIGSVANHWFVRRSPDGGESWEPEPDDFLQSSSSAQSVATSASGNTFVVGSGVDDDGSGTHWLVRRLAAQ